MHVQCHWYRTFSMCGKSGLDADLQLRLQLLRSTALWLRLAAGNET